MNDHDSDVSDALKAAAPPAHVPEGLVAGARRKRARSRALLGGVAGATVLAVGVGLAVSPFLRPGNSPEASVQDSAASTGSTSVPNAEAPADQQTDFDVSDTELKTAVDASQLLAWQAIVGAGTGNQVVSPSSLALSLAMAAEGAEGASLSSVDEALGLSGETRSRTFAELRRSLGRYETPPSEVDLKEPPATPQLHLASRVVAIDMQPKQQFVDRLSRYFAAPLVHTNGGEAQGLLNEWVKENTAGLIEKSGIEVTPETKVVTQDALLFSAAWRTPFERDDIPLDFDDVGQVDGLQGVLEARYAEGARWTAVRLPYSSGFTADIIMPTQGLAPTDLTATELAEASAALAATPESTVDLTMPKLDLASTVNLLKALPDLDLTELDGIFDGAYAEQWVQQSVLKVNAKGTVGAAVTEMAVAEAAAPSGERFVVNRGYVFRVAEAETGLPLFLASIVDPSATSG